MSSLATAHGRLSWTARTAHLPAVTFVLPLMLAGFALFVGGFASTANLLNIGVQSAILLLLALPMTFILMSEGIDLSVGALIGLASVVLALMLGQGSSLGAAFAAVLLIGLAVGVLNGLLVVHAGIPPFVVTLGTLGLAQGVALVLTDGASVIGIGQTLPALYASTTLGLPFPILVGIAGYAIFHLLMYHTRYGAYVFAIGGNRESLALAGVRANVYHVSIYALGGLMVGFAGVLFAGRMNAGHPVAGIGMEFDAIAAAVLGGTERGNGWLPGALLGVLTVGVLKNGLNVLAVPSSLQVAGVGLLVIGVLMIDSARRRS